MSVGDSETIASDFPSLAGLGAGTALSRRRDPGARQRIIEQCDKAIGELGHLRPVSHFMIEGRIRRPVIPLRDLLHDPAEERAVLRLGHCPADQFRDCRPPVCRVKKILGATPRVCAPALVGAGGRSTH